jgi:N-acetylglucosaminyldiphosphoundecaprenol N-acetyl-beta-D-mannosaminyltransferase
MNILITGIHGFVGTNLVNSYKSQHSIYGLDIIWVSLGAPKQELFMNRILPHLNTGVMFGIGAVFNFYVGDIKLSSFHIGSLKFIWINRLISEPRKMIKRNIPYILLIPRLFYKEWVAYQKQRKLKNLI